MRWTRKFTATATLAALALGLTIGPAGAQAATTTLCSSQTESVAGGSYTAQNNEWGSSAPECISTDGNADFTVANSSIDNATNGAPGGYPSLYRGCHWGACTSGSGLPIPVSSMSTGTVTSSWSTTQPGGSNDYDVAYDIWFNTTPTTSGQPNGAELMIWLNHNGPVQPFGSQVGTASIGGRGYTVWEGNQGWNTISYTMNTGTTSVSNLDIDQIVADAVSRGYIQNSWYLIDVEAGFELWQGGAGLATNSFSVNVNGSSTAGGGTGGGGTGGSTPPPSTGCSAAYSVVNSWSGGFQGQVTVTNTGTSSLSGWQLAWTFPGDQKINSLWNGAYTQSNAQVTVTPAAYDSTIAPGSSATIGFTATDTTGSAPPSSVTCT